MLGPRIKEPFEVGIQVVIRVVRRKSFQKCDFTSFVLFSRCYVHLTSGLLRVTPERLLIGSTYEKQKSTMESTLNSQRKQQFFLHLRHSDHQRFFRPLLKKKLKIETHFTSSNPQERLCKTSA